MTREAVKIKETKLLCPICKTFTTIQRKKQRQRKERTPKKTILLCM